MCAAGVEDWVTSCDRAIGEVGHADQPEGRPQPAPRNWRTRWPAIADVAVLGTPHEQWGEAVTAVVALNPGAALTLAELSAFARDKLAGYKIPLRLEFVDALPRNPAGKVLK